MIERSAATPTLDGNKLVGLVAPTYDGTDSTQYDLFHDGSTMERFAPGCWDDFLKSNPDVKCYAHHDRKQILGRTSAKTLELTLDKAGLMYSVDVPDTTVGRDTKTSVSRRDISGASVGMLPSTRAVWSREGGKDIRTIVKAFLDHVAVVGDPAYLASTCNLRENLEQERAAFETEKWLAKIAALETR